MGGVKISRSWKIFRSQKISENRFPKNHLRTLPGCFYASPDLSETCFQMTSRCFFGPASLMPVIPVESRCGAEGGGGCQKFPNRGKSRVEKSPKTYFLKIIIECSGSVFMCSITSQICFRKTSRGFFCTSTASSMHAESIF